MGDGRGELDRLERPEVVPFGDAAVLAILGDRAGDSVTRATHAAAEEIERRRPSNPALGRPVPAHATVLVPFDPSGMDRAAAVAAVRDAVALAARRATTADADGTPTTATEIPVRYGGDDGPDLADVAASLDLRPADVVEMHAGARYRVLFLGFAPGFAYLGGLPEALVTPRRSSPRPRVPAGSVAIAGEHTAVYPQSMPGGWNLIGRSDAVLFDATATPPAVLAPRSAVRFVPAR